MRYGPLKLERIRNLRIDHDLSQQEMADMLHVSQSVYCDYELGKIGYPLEVIIKLADFYGTSTDYLLERTDEMRPYPATKRP